PTKGIERGYAIPGFVPNNYSDAQLDNSYYALNSSISALGRDSDGLNGDPSLARVLRGDLSLGAFLSERTDYYGDNYYTPPGPINSGPGVNHYYSGGYITQRYGSGGGTQPNSLDAIQIEVTAAYRTQSDAARNQLAADLAG